MCQVEGEKHKGRNKVQTHLAIWSGFWEPSVSIPWEPTEMQNLRLFPIGVFMIPLHIKIRKLCHGFLDNCIHLLMGLLASTLAPLEFILLRVYCLGLSIYQIWTCQNRCSCKKDETILWWGEFINCWKILRNQRRRQRNYSGPPTLQKIKRERERCHFLAA